MKLGSDLNDMPPKKTISPAGQRWQCWTGNHTDEMSRLVVYLEGNIRRTRTESEVLQRSTTFLALYHVTVAHDRYT